MSFNLIDLVKDQLSEQVMEQLGGVLGGSAAQNSSAISSAIPGVLSSLVNAGSTNAGAEAMLGAINDQDDSILDNLGSLLGGNDQSSMMSMGTDILGSLLGGGGSGLGSLVSSIAGFSGAGKGPVKSLLGLLAPVIFGVIKRKLTGSGGLNVSSLMGMLGDQKDNIAAALPSDFSQQTSSTTTDNVRATTQPIVNEEKKSSLGMFLPLALIAGALFLGYNMFMKGDGLDSAKDIMGGAVDSTTEGLADTVNSAKDGVVDTIDSAKEGVVGAADSAKEGMADTVDAAKDSVGDLELGSKLNDVMGSVTGSLNGITDTASAEAALPKLEEASGQLGGLKTMLDKLPEAARAPIMKTVSQGLPQIQGIVDKLAAIPGVGAIIKPAADNLLSQLASFQ